MYILMYRSFKNFSEELFLNDLVLVLLSDIESIDRTDKILDSWYTLFQDIVNKQATIRTHRVKNNIQPDWLDPEILDKMKERDKLKKKGNIDEYKILRNQISSLIQYAKKATYKSKIERGKDDPKSIWIFFLKSSELLLKRAVIITFLVSK